jgi:hypothetical protein
MGVIIVIATAFDSSFNILMSRRLERKAIKKAQLKESMAGGVK